MSLAVNFSITTEFVEVTSLTTPTSFVKDADTVDSSTNVLEIALDKDTVLVTAALMFIKRATNNVAVVFTPILINLARSLITDTVLLVTIVLTRPIVLKRLVVLIATTDNSKSLIKLANNVAVTVDDTVKAAFVTLFNTLAAEVPVAAMYLTTDLTKLTVDVTAIVRVCNTFFVPKEAKDDWENADVPNIT